MLLTEVQQLGQTLGKQSPQKVLTRRITGTPNSSKGKLGSSEKLKGAGTDTLPTPATSTSLARRHNYQINKMVYKRTISFAWLTRKTWHFAASLAATGWDIRLRAWCLRPRGSEIFRACRKGDTATVRRLLQRGEASMYDFYCSSFDVSINTST